MEQEKIVRLAVRKILRENISDDIETPSSDNKPKTIEVTNQLLADVTSADKVTVIKNEELQSTNSSYLKLSYDGENYLNIPVGSSKGSSAEQAVNFELKLVFSSMGYALSFFGNGTIYLEREEDGGTVSAVIPDEKFEITKIELSDYNEGATGQEHLNGEMKPSELNQNAFESARKYILVLINQSIDYDG